MHDTQATRLGAADLATASLTAHLIPLFLKDDRMTLDEAHAFLNRLGLGSFDRTTATKIKRDSATRARRHIFGATPDCDVAESVDSPHASDHSFDVDLIEPDDPFELIRALEKNIETMKSDMIMALVFLPPGPVKSRFIKDYLGVSEDAQWPEHGLRVSRSDMPEASAARPIDREGSCTCA